MHDDLRPSPREALQFSHPALQKAAHEVGSSLEHVEDHKGTQWFKEKAVTLTVWQASGGESQHTDETYG